LWIPYRELVAPESRVVHERRFWAGTQRAPGLRHADRVIWGMTYRVLATLTRRLGHDLPETA
jgi:hypothetical protein